MPCWSKEKGAKIIKPDDGGDDVFCHVRDPMNGEVKVVEGNTAGPKSFTRTCCPHPFLRRPSSVASHKPDQQQHAAWWRDVESTVGSSRCRSKPVSRSNRAGASSRPRRKRHQDTECRQNRFSHEASQNKNDEASGEWTEHGKCWRAAASGTRRHEEGDRGHPGVIPRTWQTFNQVKSHSAVDA